MLESQKSIILNHLNESDHMAKEPFRFYVKKHKRQFFFGIFCLLFTNALDALPPLIIGKIIDQITDQKPFIDTSLTICLLVGVALAVAIFRYFWRLHWGRYSHRTAQDVKNKIFSKYLNLGQSFFEKNPVGKLMSLINNDVNAFRMAIGPGVLILLDALFISAFVIPLMIYLSPSLTWKTLIFLPLIPFIISKIEALIHDNYKKQQQQFSELSATTQEILSGIRTIKSFAQEDHHETVFNDESKKLENYSNTVARLEAAFSPILEVGVSTGCVILLFYASPEISSGALTIGALFSFYQYIQTMMWPMAAIGIGLTFWQKGKASMSRILELLNETTDTPDVGESDINIFKSLELKNLNFNYDGDNKGFSLKNISLEIKPGEIIGFLGKTGSGKSTITDLISGIYPTEEGSILINGQPIQKYKQDSLHDFITYVPQDTFLFSDNIYNNTLLSTDKSNEEVIDTLKTVQLNDEILNMENQHQTVLGEKGVNISGGQKQRLALARGLIRDTKLLILDDSFSAIDANTEKQIIEVINSKLNNLSVIIISHRLASLKLADKIFVFNEGTIEASGVHEELLTSSSTYKEVYENQSSNGGTA